MNIKRIKTGKAHVKDAKEAPKPVNNEAQNNAFAGVGSPIKEVVWRSSKLNLANRNAEKAAITNAI